MKPEILNNWNPWWNTGIVPKVLQGVPREIHPLLFKSMHEKEIIALTGVRRCGKTTTMYQLITVLLKNVEPASILYVNLDDEVLKKETLESIYSFYRQYKNPDKKAYMFFDEIQNIPGWENFLRKHYDLQDNVKFIVSGSSTDLLRGEYATLLTGRNLTFALTPLTFKEFLQFENIDWKNRISLEKNRIIHALHKYLEYGGFPEVFFKEDELKKILLKQYFDDILYKDIVKRHAINAQKITSLAVYLLTNIANSFTIRKIRNFTNLSIDSIKDYISYLEESFLFILVDHFSYSLKERFQIARKGYAIDCGLRNVVGMRFSIDSGRLAENCVCAELKRMGKEIYYWKGQNEIDFIIKEHDNTIMAINVSYTDKIEDREIKGLLEFKKAFKKTKKLILLTHDIEGEKEGILIMPLWKWLLEKEG